MEYGCINRTPPNGLEALHLLEDNDLARVVLTGLHAIGFGRDELAEAVRMVREGNYWWDDDVLRLDTSSGEYVFAESGIADELAQQMAESIAEEQAGVFYHEIGALVPDTSYVTFETENLARDIILGDGLSILATYDGHVEEFTMHVTEIGIVGPSVWFNVWRDN